MSEFEILPSGYNGLSLGERLFPNMSAGPGSVFITPQEMSPKSEVIYARDMAVRMARDAERRSEYIRSGLDKHADMVVGPRLMVQPRPDWTILESASFPEAARTALSDSMRAWFNNWAYSNSLNQDAEGHYDFGGLMWMAYRQRRGPDGETAGIIHQDEERRIKLGWHWSTFVQIINPQRISTPPLKSMDEALNLGIFKGRQLDEYGRWEGLYILKHEPDEQMIELNDYSFVPRVTTTGRPQVWHDFEKTRAGAQRGITDLTTTMRHVGMFDNHDDAMLAASILDAMFAPHIQSNSDPETIAERMAPPGDAPDAFSQADMRLGFYEKARIKIGPAYGAAGGKRVAVLPEGDKIVSEMPTRAAQDPTAFLNHFLRRFASVTGTTFEQLANNWSDANYSAARAALLDLWRGIIRRRTIFSHIPSNVYAAVIEEAIARGRVKIPAGAPPFAEFRDAYLRCTWMGPGMGQIDPEKEAKAREINLRLKTTTREKECAVDGTDYYDVFEQYALEVEEAEELGFDLDPPLPGQQAGAEQGQETPEDDRSGNERRAKPKPAPKEE